MNLSVHCITGDSDQNPSVTQIAHCFLCIDGSKNRYQSMLWFVDGSALEVC